MDKNIKIKYHKWKYKEIKKLYSSCEKIIGVKENQIYQPYFSLYFHIHNTKNSHKLIDIDRRYFIKEITGIISEKHHTSNTQLNCEVYDKRHNSVNNMELFCKCIPLLDPLYFMMNNYNNIIKRNPLLPSAYNYNTSSKINNMNNNAYIDTFFSYISSELTLNNILPSFPIYYGSLNGINKQFNYDITDDYSNLRDEEWFYKNLGKNYKIDMYVDDEHESDDDNESYDDNEADGNESGDGNESDDENESYDDNEADVDESDDEHESNSDINSEDSDRENYNSDDYISSLNNIPCQLLFIEKLEGTIEDLISSNVKDLDVNIIKSCIFQISFALLYLQKKFNFTHNDLHVNNVMFKKTDKTYLYYKFNNIYFKVPTHGFIFKIIDFGRAIFTFHNKLFFNDTFAKHGEAEGQYTYQNNILFTKDKETKELIKPNYSFDLCRLAITILDVCNYNKLEDYKDKKAFTDFIYNLTLNYKEESLADLNDDFEMYVSIAKESNNAKPEKVIQDFIFKDYRIKKKSFPKKLYYSLD